MPLPINMIRDACTAIRATPCNECPRGTSCRVVAERAARSVITCLYNDYPVRRNVDSRRAPDQGYDRSILGVMLDKHLKA